MKRTLTILAAVTVAATITSPARATEVVVDPYVEAIWRTSEIVWDQQVIEHAARHGLDVVNVAWEDTGRFKDSSVGPNISDVTIQVQHDGVLTLMPVVRHPNFSDKTADLDLDDFFLLVGNEDGDELRRVSLRQYLGDFRTHLSDPDSWRGREDSLLADRDSHVLVSAQAAFLPVPREGIAEFNPVIFNYQSYQGDPAVLTIVATREGTSATIIDNVRDGFDAGPTWGQRLFFNQDGERASFTGQRLSDFTAENGDRDGVDSVEAAGQAGLNMVLVVQVPLKQKNPARFGSYAETSDDVAFSPPAEARSDVEVAVIGHGEVEGPFTEIDGLRIERDERFPIRVTVQFYKATADGSVSGADIAEIAAEIDRVYADADYVGSLVTEGDTERPTEHDGPKYQPAGWWEAFWQRHEDNTGLSRADTYRMLEALRLTAIRWIPWA